MKKAATLPHLAPIRVSRMLATMPIAFLFPFLSWSCGLAGGTQASGGDAGPGPDAPGAEEENVRELGDVDDVPLIIESGAAVDGDCEGLHTGIRCWDHSDCADWIFCNGEERCGLFCGEYFCYTTDLKPVCGDPPPDRPECHPGVCIEEQQACAYPLKDSDADGYADAGCGGDDCNDGDPAVHPGAAEICDGSDNNCDLTADESSWTAGGPPVRISAEGIEVIDADIAALDGEWAVAWVETSGPIRIGKYGPGVSQETLPAPNVLSASEGAVEVRLLVSSGETFVLWIENGSAIKGKKVSLDPVFTEEESVILFPASPVTPLPEVGNLDAAVAPESRQAGVFFRNRLDGNNDEITMVPADLDSFSGGVFPEAVRISEAMGFSGFPAAAAGPSAMAVAWEDRRNGGSEIYVSTVNVTEGSAGSPVKLTASPGDSRRPSIAAGPSGFQVAWMDENAGPFNIVAARLDAAGVPVHLPVAMAAGAGSKYYPALSADPRGDLYRDQAALLFVIDESAVEKLAMTSLGTQQKEIKAGLDLHTTDKDILSPSLSTAGDRRAALWIEGRFARKELFLLTMECVPK
jgi:hypothetical protein